MVACCHLTQSSTRHHCLRAHHALSSVGAFGGSLSMHHSQEGVSYARNIVKEQFDAMAVEGGQVLGWYDDCMVHKVDPAGAPKKLHFALCV